MQWSVKRKGAAESNARFVDPTGLKSAVLNSEVVLEQKNASLMDNQPGQSPLNSIPELLDKTKRCCKIECMVLVRLTRVSSNRGIRRKMKCFQARCAASYGPKVDQNYIPPSFRLQRKGADDQQRT